MHEKGVEAVKNIDMTQKTKDKVIAIGIPHMGLFHWQTVASLLSLQFPKGYILKYHMVGSSLVYDARESIAKFAIENEADYLLYLDADMVPPADTLCKMINIFDTHEECGMVSGMAFKRIPPFQPCFYTKLGYDPKNQKAILESPVEFPLSGLIQLQGAGMACSMLKVSILKDIPRPWFFPLPNMGEDLTFCLKAKQKNVVMYLDLSIDVGHISSMAITKAHFEACYEEHKNSNSDKPLFEEVK